jgi:parallel beta-helix repeat protein
MKVDRTIDGAEEISNQTVHFKGSLTVPAGTTLVVTNSTLVFDIVQPGSTGIYVEKAGQLSVLNSTITSSGHFVFEARGETSIQGSIVSRTWGDTNIDTSGGIKVYARKFTISNSTVSEGLGNGISVKYVNPFIANCLITNNKGHGINVDTGSPTIQNNTITGNGVGIYLDGSKGNIYSNNITRNHGSGIHTSDSYSWISNNTITLNDGAGIYLDGGKPRMNNNTITANKGGKYEYPIASAASIITLFAITIAPMVTIAYIYEKTVRRKRLGQPTATKKNDSLDGP